MFVCQSIPDAEALIIDALAKDNVLNPKVQSIWNKLESKLMPTFGVDSAEINYQFAEVTLKSFISYYLCNAIEAGGSNIRMFGILPDEPNDYIKCRTTDIKVATKVLESYMTRNVSTMGIFTESWGRVLGSDILHAVHEYPGTIYEHIRVRMIQNETDDDEYDVLTSNEPDSVDGADDVDVDADDDVDVETLFEQHRQYLISMTFDANHNYNIQVDNTANVESTEDNKTCVICYECADCVCDRCGAAICIKCANRLTKSTATCPNCQFAPFGLKNIKGRPLFTSIGEETYVS